MLRQRWLEVQGIWGELDVTGKSVVGSRRNKGI